MRNSPFSFALLILIILFYALCQCHPARAQTVSDLDLITTLDLTLTDKLYLTNVEATGSAKDKSVTLSQLVTLFGPTIEVSGSNITSGTVPNARLDSDLSAIAALTTTTYGRDLLAVADAAGLRTLAGLGSLATQSGTFSGTSSGTNTGDQDLSAYAPLANPTFTGTINGAALSLSGGISVTGNIATGSGNFETTVGNIATGSGVISGNGSGITNLNASNISAGSLSWARISQNGATTGQAPIWNGTTWVPTTLTGAALGTAQSFTALNKFTAGLESYWGNVTDNGAVLGLNAGITSVSSDPVAIGFFAVGGNVSPGASVIGIGRHAGYSAKGGNWVAMGHAAGQYAHTADNAVLIGYLAGRNNSQQPTFSVWDSVMIGHNAGAQADSAAISVMIGSEAGKNATSAIGSVIIGYAAGQNATTATNAVLIGRQAGSALTSAANRLVIDGNTDYSTTTTGLIYGEFDNRRIALNARTINLGVEGGIVTIGGGASYVTTAPELRFFEPSSSGTNYTGFKSPELAGNVVYTLPTADGSSGQTLTTNGSGVLSWASSSAGSGSVRKVTVITKTDTASVTPGANTWGTVWSFTYSPTQSDSVILLRGILSVGVSVTIPVRFRVANGSTALSVGATAGSRLSVGGGVGSNGTSPEYYGVYSGPVLATDAPGSTSSQTYNVQLSSASGGATLHLNRSGDDSNAAASPRAISSFEIVELAP